jgi:hypothetical protein
MAVILDSRLMWNEHVDVKLQKAQNMMWVCRRAYGVAWGLGPRVVHWLYVSFITYRTQYPEKTSPPTMDGGQFSL